MNANGRQFHFMNILGFRPVFILGLITATTLVSPAAVPAAAAPPRFFPPDAPGAAAYTLPDPLRTLDGRTITTVAEWEKIRRPELLELFRAQVYGRVPDTAYTQAFRVVSENSGALGGAATRKEIEITVSARGKALAIRLFLFTPNHATSPVPAFLLMGNSSVDHYDPAVARPSGYWPVETGIARGYAMAAFWSWDADPDQKADVDFKDGAHALLDAGPRQPDSWATIAAWAWGMSRCLDYLVTDPAIAADRVAVVGHSRAGKTALWAAAQDERFAMACSNDSGTGGAALSRRRTKEKESVEAINRLFPHWFATNFKAFGGREQEMPVDQHLLLALIAPRTVCVASASQDLWADPRGEFLSLVATRPAYELYGLGGLGDRTEMPPIGEPLHGEGAHYWIREGRHALTAADWKFYFDSADLAFGRVAPKPIR